MRTSTTLRRGAAAALVPALLIAGTTTAHAAEAAEAPASTAPQANTGTASDAASNATKDSTSLSQLSSGGTSELLKLGSSVLGLPDFTGLLGSGTATTTSPNAAATGVEAVKQAAAQEEEKAGHKLFELTTPGENTVHVSFTEAFDHQQDAAALTALAQAAKDNGVTLTADR